MELYEWQKEIRDHEGDLCIVGGRQTGKSVAVAYRISHLAEKYPKSTHLIIAHSERQESFLFEKVKEELSSNGLLSRARQTLSKLTLRNGSSVIKFPVGKTGYYAKGATVDFLYCDEAGYMAELVWDSVIPMLAVQRSKGLGWITLLSTAFGKRGYFYECYIGNKYKPVVIEANMVPHLSEEFLDEELERMGQRRFDQEYMAKFLDEAGQYFPTDLIVKQMNFRFWNKSITPERLFYLGIDFGGMGADEEAYACGEIVGKKIRNIHNETIALSRMRDSLRMTDKLDSKFNFKKIYIDPAGMGVGYEDIFKERYGRRVIGLNNASKSTEKQSKILKEDLYSNTLRLLEEGTLELVYDERMLKSLQSVMIIDGKIEGKDDHLAEALNRMAWAMKAKGLNLYIV